MTKLRNAWLTIRTFLVVFVVIGVLASEISSELGQDSNDIIFTEEEIVQRQCQHEYSDWTITKESSCEEEGEKTRTCPKCNHIDIQIIRASHTVVQLPSEPATCTATGLTQGSYCSVCGKTIVSQQTVPMLPHNTVSHDGQAATCTENGWKAYVTCSDCDYTTYEEIIAEGHDTYGGTVDPTCNDEGYDYYRCRNCTWHHEFNFVDPTGEHVWLDNDWVTYKDPTCTEIGKERNECYYCETVTIRDVPALGHSYIKITEKPTCTAQGYTNYYCTICTYSYDGDYVDALGHNYESVVTEPTCTAQGYTTHTCSRCSDSYKDTYTDALGHTEVIDAGRASTCILPGITEGSHCSVCNTVIKEQELLPLAEHNYVAVVTEPTCETSGYTTNTCSVCGGSYKDAFKVSLGHNYISAVTEPTCTAQGYTTHTCSRCSDSYKDTYTDALGHTVVIDPEEFATCTQTGLTEGSHCSVCNTVLVAQTVIPKEAHSPEANNYVDATCTEQGYIEYVCGECGIYLHTTYSDALGHDYSSVVTKPTCEAQGYTTHTCSNCGDSYKDTYTNALGHTPGEWVQETTQWIKECNTCGNVIDTEEIADLTFTYLPDDTYAVRATDVNNLPSRVIIPARYKGCAVAVIGNDAFNEASITSVILPEDITIIEDCAFFGTNISEIFIPSSVVLIEGSAFELCSNLKTVVFEPSSSNFGITIGNGAFCDCTSLETVIFNDRVQKIEGSAFSCCESLKEIYISSTVVTMGAYVFDECSDLTVYCQAVSQPSGWDEDWNYSGATVVWGYTPQ